MRRPRVAILATGDEVQRPGEPLQPGMLYDSNSYDTAAAVRRWGGEPELLGIARDNFDELRAKLREGLDADLLITSAGVSAGAFDMVKDALAELGSIDFWSVRMRPARPIACGLLRAPDGPERPSPRAAGGIPLARSWRSWSSGGPPWRSCEARSLGPCRRCAPCSMNAS